MYNKSLIKFLDALQVFRFPEFGKSENPEIQKNMEKPYNFKSPSLSFDHLSFATDIWKNSGGILKHKRVIGVYWMIAKR